MDERPLEERLAAAQRTIAALMRRVEDKVASGETAFAVLEQAIALERIVADKTREIEAHRRALEEALANLRKAQTELMQAQKLESVGRLASGIAHEINTPVQFVGDSVHFLREAFQDVLSVLELHRQLHAEVAPGAPLDPQRLEALAAAEAAVDLPYLLENVPKSFDRSVDGLSRVATLVRSMKEFAHPEQKSQAPADLNQALTSTLTIARNEYKFVADVETSFGELPPVLCHVGELNQVFLNLVVNAAHAIEPLVQGTGRRGLIRVETRREGELACVAISDTGTGIPEEIHAQIFDPFFTTKPVGKGTGQGLAIARSVVVEKHGGTLTFETAAGRGTTFFVRLPVEGAHAARAR